MAMSLDLAFVRSQFPAFKEPSLAGQAFLIMRAVLMLVRR